ncbi:MAG TPA: preprotein translocase subunit SecG [Eubacteriales bacterium]|jgi:preprotein translocase subunit SecG|nr:preprotein translocase subunit SecG [Eubacteriales bacterium]HRU84720.1 preprotein translocase subunit SecG [Eubacteriales bacterium]
MLNNVMLMMMAAAGGVSSIDFETRQAVGAALLILMTVLAIAMVVIVLMQRGTEDNLGVLTGAATDTYYGKNKAQSKENTLKKVTFIIFGLLLVTSIVYFIIQVIV